MADKAKMYHFRASWKKNYHKKTAAVVMDYQAKDFEQLLEILKTSEGVSKDTCTFLVVHRINGDGSTSELYDYDEEMHKNGEGTGTSTVINLDDRRRTRQVKTQSSQERVLDTVSDLLERARTQSTITTPGRTITKPTVVTYGPPKPRIRLKNPEGQKFILGGAFYKAFELPSRPAQKAM